MTVLHLFAKACQTSVLGVGPTWPWWKYFKGDVWPYLISLRLALAVSLIIKILSVCIEQTLLGCVYFSHFYVLSWAGGCSWLDQRLFDLCHLVCHLKWTFSSVGDNLALRNEGNLGMVAANWHFCVRMAHGALKSHAGFYGNTSFYTGKNSRLGLWGHCLHRD